MGSAASTKLKCPNDYDKQKFNMILKLYDNLDKNGDQVIDTLELKDIANLHIENRKTELSKLRIKEEQDYKSILNNGYLEYEKKKLELKSLHVKNIDYIKNSHISKDVSFINDINKLNKMKEVEKCQTFLNIVSNDGKHIEFWKFFDYMKDRTQDIKNIEVTS